jgi:hypothetical protein
MMWFLGSGEEAAASIGDYLDANKAIEKSVYGPGDTLLHIAAKVSSYV